MAETALWKTLYTPGHDTALLVETAEGHELSGMAVFAHDGQPARLFYKLDLNPDWSTRSGRVEGHAGTTRVEHWIERDALGWTLDGVRQHGLAGVVDLDFGFTPATNCPQLKRMALEVGQSAEIIVAWMDVDSSVLEPLPQIYRRTDEDAYAYNSPQGPYRATLRIAANGFVRDYPGLWAMC
jgi:uncharacterized protein